jgi:dipeptidyl aminopeptidase/acylaminoacyl peptidase
LIASTMLLSGVLNAKNYEHSDLIESFAVLPAVTAVSVSPDGKHVIIRRATTKDGDYILEVRKTKDLNKKPVLFNSKHMEIQSGSWLNNDLMAVTFRQNIQDGNDNYWVNKFAIVSADGKGDWRVPFPKDNQARFNLINQLRDDPKHVLLSYDIDDDRRADIIKYNIYNGRTRTVLRANSKLSGGFIADSKGEIRAANAYDAKNNSLDQYVRLSTDNEWELIFKNRADNRERFDFLYFSVENPQEVYISANRGEDTTGIYTYNIETKAYSDRLFGLKNVNVGGVVLSRKNKDRGRLLGYSYTGKEPTVSWLDEYEQNLRDAINAAFPNKYVSLSSRSEDDNQIVVRTTASNDPGTYYLLSNKKDVQLIGERAPLVNRELLGDVKYIKYPARDG